MTVGVEGSLLGGLLGVEARLEVAKALLLGEQLLTLLAELALGLELDLAQLLLCEW